MAIVRLLIELLFHGCQNPMVTKLAINRTAHNYPGVDFNTNALFHEYIITPDLYRYEA